MQHANIKLFYHTIKEEVVCLKCGKQRQKGYHRESIQAHYRLFDIDTAERIVDKVSKKVNDNNNTVVNVTPISNQPKPDDIRLLVSLVIEFTLMVVILMF